MFSVLLLAARKGWDFILKYIQCQSSEHTEGLEHGAQGTQALGGGVALE